MAVANGVIVAAVVAEVEQDPGVLAFFDETTFAFLDTAPTGAQPEGISVSPDGTLIACVNEGTPEEYEPGFVDPPGSVTIVEVTGSTGFVSQKRMHKKGVGWGTIQSMTILFSPLWIRRAFKS